MCTYSGSGCPSASHSIMNGLSLSLFCCATLKSNSSVGGCLMIRGGELSEKNNKEEKQQHQYSDWAQRRSPNQGERQTSLIWHINQGVNLTLWHALFLVSLVHLKSCFPHLFITYSVAVSGYFCGSIVLDWESGSGGP